jgi:hypothetical protein
MNPKTAGVLLVFAGGMLTLSGSMAVRVTGFVALIYGATFLVLSRNRKL